MNLTRNCCRIYPLMLLVISFILATMIWYFEEGIRSFSFLTDKGEIFNFLGTVLFIAVLPIGIFYLATESRQLTSGAKTMALLGFLPGIFFLLFVIL